MYVSRYAFQLGKPIWLDPKLNMFHERQDILTQPAKGVEKRMLELTNPILHRRVSGPWAALPFAARAAIMGAYRKMKKIFLYRKTMSLNDWETLAAFPAILLIFTADCLLIAAMAVWPPFLKKTLRYQAGDKWKEAYKYMGKVTPKRYQDRFGSIFSRESWPTRKLS